MGKNRILNLVIMKKALFIIALILIGCKETPKGVSATGVGDPGSSAGNYSGWVSFENQGNWKVHMGQVTVRVEEIDSVFYVTSIDPPYRIDPNGFGTGMSESTDTVYITEKYFENDSTYATRVSDTTYIFRRANEEVQLEEDQLIYSVLSETTQEGVKTVTIGKGELRKIN